MSDLPFLLADISRLTRRRFDERARLIGVTRPQWRLLVTLSRDEGLNQGALAERLEVEPITLCRMVDRLEEAGLIERRRDPADRRAWRLYLSDKSRPLLDRLRAIADEVFGQALGEITPAEHDAVFETLTRMRANLARPLPANEAAHG